jgi:hypothetical protein
MTHWHHAQGVTARRSPAPMRAIRTPSTSASHSRGWHATRPLGAAGGTGSPAAVATVTPEARPVKSKEEIQHARRNADHRRGSGHRDPDRSRVVVFHAAAERQASGDVRAAWIAQEAQFVLNWVRRSRRPPLRSLKGPPPARTSGRSPPGRRRERLRGFSRHRDDWLGALAALLLAQRTTVPGRRSGTSA